MTPTQRSLKHLRAAGYNAEVVERWNSAARRRNDLFGFIDILAIRNGETLGVQTTTSSNVSARVRKIEGHANFGPVLRAGWRVLVHGWRPNGTLRVVEPVLDDFQKTQRAQGEHERKWDVV